jgi:hypothetical protein
MECGAWEAQRGGRGQKRRLKAARGASSLGHGAGVTESPETKRRSGQQPGSESGQKSLNAHLSIAFGCLRFTPALNSSKLPPLVVAMESRDLACFEMWGSDIPVFCASPSRAAERGVTPSGFRKFGKGAKDTCYLYGALPLKKRVASGQQARKGTGA